MPIVVFALLTYLGGLLAGFAGSIVVGLVAVTAATALGARRGRTAAVAFAALATGGVVAARAASSDAQRCLADAERLQTVSVVLDDSAYAGAFARGRVHPCDAYVSLAVARGSAMPGSLILARGALIRTDRGVNVKNATVTLVRGPGLLRRWRARAGRAIEEIFRDDAPLVKALLIADWRELTPEVKDRYAASGLSHMLSISGLHIAMIAAALERTQD